MLIVLENRSASGEILQATFLPEKGMNLVSFKKGPIEVIDQTTRTRFEERFGGLGPLIGPHFHQRKPEIIPKIKEESLFPHIAAIKASGAPDPFSHGISRYAPWQAQFTKTHLTGYLSGKDLWNGVPLEELEGQNFKMKFDAELSPNGLNLDLSIVSDTASLVGIHYYYHLPKGTGTIRSQVQKEYLDKTVKKTLPASWSFDQNHHLNYELNQETDLTFYPFPHPCEGKITLDAVDYLLTTRYKTNSQENSWQLFHPSHSSYVCIEPLSSQDPRHPNLTASSIKIDLEIESKERA
jgi:hypothetical protein